jgi:type II secretory pathway pseudopilin PulG
MSRWGKDVAFTLIEMLVVIAIVGEIGEVTVFATRPGR